MRGEREEASEREKLELVLRGEGSSRALSQERGREREAL